MAINKNTLQEYFRNSLREPELVIDTIVPDLTGDKYLITTTEGIKYSYQPKRNNLIEQIGETPLVESIPTIFQNQENSIEQEQSQFQQKLKDANEQVLAITNDYNENIKEPYLKEPYTSLQKHTKGLEYLIGSLHKNWDRVEIEKVTFNPQKGPYQILDINFNVTCGEINSGSMNKTFRFKFEEMPEPKVEVKKSVPRQSFPKKSRYNKN